MSAAVLRENTFEHECPSSVKTPLRTVARSAESFFQMKLLLLMMLTLDQHQPIKYRLVLIYSENGWVLHSFFFFAVMPIGTC